MAVSNKSFTNMHIFPTKALYDANISSVEDTDIALVNAENGTYHLGGIIDKVLGQNGYIKFDNGLIIQWGKFLESDGAADIRSFPIEFPNQCFAAAVCDPLNSTNSNSVNVSDAYDSWIEPISKSKFYIGLDDDFEDHQAGSVKRYVSMIAIGN